MAKLHLHLDGLAVAAAGLSVYAILGFPWWLFGVLILAPDLFMLGYVFNPKVGSRIYNIGHSMIWPVALGLLGRLLSLEGFVAVGLIWMCHIGIDHAFGYGYKYEDRFKHTHFSVV